MKPPVTARAIVHTTITVHFFASNFSLALCLTTNTAEALHSDMRPRLFHNSRASVAFEEQKNVLRRGCPVKYRLIIAWLFTERQLFAFRFAVGISSAFADHFKTGKTDHQSVTIDVLFISNNSDFLSYEDALPFSLFSRIIKYSLYFTLTFG